MTDRHDEQGFHLAPGEGEFLWSVGDTFTIKVGGDVTGGALTVFEVIVPPHTGPPPHVHHGEDEAVYVVEGEVVLRQGDRTFTAGPGTFAFLPRGVVHGYENLGTETARLLSIAAPAGIEGFFREAGSPAREGEPPPAPGPEEGVRAATAAAKFGLEIPQVDPPLPR